MNLAAYARRVGLEGYLLRPNLETLRALHIGHVQSIPFENLDVHLGRTMGLAPSAAFEKLVRRQRGGWCYEMNGLHGWALEAIGFRVIRMAGAVLRSQRGESSLGRHLMLCVELDQAYLVDVGLGDGLIEPIPLAEGEHVQGTRHFRLERLQDRWWRFHNHGSAYPQNVDFRLEPANEQLLDERCNMLQTEPSSPFVRNIVCQRHLPGQFAFMVGRVVKTFTEPGASATERTISSAAEYVATLADPFGLYVPEAAQLWPKIERHDLPMFGR
jgi:N-hydroxyarylamine O-acetyltransferase